MQPIPSHSQTIFDWLYLSDQLAHADLIIGFGHFDQKIPEQCIKLYHEKWAPKVLFTGGIGAGTADLGMPEAQAFMQIAQKQLPNLPADDFFVEDQSTNTGENVRFSVKLLEKAGLCMGKEIKSAILVANPFRQRRVWLTCQLLLPGIALLNVPPQSSLEEEIELFNTKNEELLEQLPGEVGRIIKYPDLGFIAPCQVPAAVKRAANIQQ